jgi:hypothetical protein
LELYDWRADPHELHNLAEARPDAAAALRERLDAHRAQNIRARQTEPERTEIDEETRKQLEALGYISSVQDNSGDSSSREGADSPAPPPGKTLLFSSFKVTCAIARAQSSETDPPPRWPHGSPVNKGFFKRDGSSLGKSGHTLAKRGV